MARIRTIKPEFPQSESMGRVSRDARLLFVMLWTIADDHGRTRAHSRMLASLLFPYDDDAGILMGNWLAELEKQGCITLYEVNGSQYLQITKWSSHQKIDRPSKPQHPGIEESSVSTRDVSRDTRERSSEDLDLDLYQGRERTKEGSAEGENDLLGKNPSSPKIDEVQLVVDAYHRALPKCQRITVLNAKRRKRILSVVKIAKGLCKDWQCAYDGAEFFTAYFEECAKDPWMRGDIPHAGNPRWKQNIDVLLAEDRFAATLDKAFDGQGERG